MCRRYTDGRGRINSGRSPQSIPPWRIALGLVCLLVSNVNSLAWAQLPGQGGVPYAQLGPRPGSPAAGPQQQAHPAVARIIVPERDGTSYGSGTLVDVADQFGLVVTNWHVVRDAADKIEVVFPDGFRSFAQALKIDKDWDLAALVIWRPNVTPVRLAAAAPQPGDVLTIAGYGQGTFRALTGRCTQYLAPSVQLPREMVEVSVAARQGDSGGPIFNSRGELAGVLWGAGTETTLGSYAGRVGGFLTSVAPHLGTSQNNTQIAARLRDAPPIRTPLASHLLVQPGANHNQSAEAASSPAARDLQRQADHAAREPDRLIAVNSSLDHEPDEAELAEPKIETSRPATGSYAATVAAAKTAKQRAKSDDPAPLSSTSRTVYASAEADSVLPSAALSTSSAAGEGEPVIVEIPLSWQDFAGHTFFDQAKTVFAALGLFAVLHFFMRHSGE